MDLILAISHCKLSKKDSVSNAWRGVIYSCSLLTQTMDSFTLTDCFHVIMD